MNYTGYNQLKMGDQDKYLKQDEEILAKYQQPPESSRGLNQRKQTLRMTKNQPIYHEGYHLKIIIGLTLILLALIFNYEKNETSGKLKPKTSLTEFYHKPLDKSYKESKQIRSYDKQEEDNYLRDLNNHPRQSQHVHPFVKVASPTIGVPKKDNIFNFHRVTSLKSRQFQQRLDAFIKPYNDTNCDHKVFGAANDESYILCENFMEHSKAIVNMGIENADSFGCEITRKYPINNYVYDCDRPYAAWMCWANDRMVFEKKCFGEKVETIEGVQYTTIEQVLKERDLIGEPILMKIDLNGAEWSVLRYQDPSVLENIDQLAIEFHLPENYNEQLMYWGNLDIVETLNKYFVSVNLHMNNIYPTQRSSDTDRLYLARAFEVTFVNRKLIKINSQSRDYAQKVKNLSNDPRRPEIIMK